MPPHAGTPSQSNSSLPLYHSILLSISGDSKISLQPTSVQQLSAIPEDRELVDDEEPDQPTGKDENDGTFTPQMIIEDEYDEPHVLLQDPAPDGGYGWIIVMASFFCNLIVDGIAYTFGVFFEIFVSHFGVSKSKVALCGSILNGFYLSVGPLVSSLANRFGCRVVTIMGAIIAFIAFSLSTIAPNIETLYITYGFLGGVGMGMIFLPAIVSVGYYFTTKRAFATGIAVCGSGVGTFLFAPFCQYLLGITSWQNTLLILSFMILLCAGFGGLMRPLNVHAKTVLGDGEIDQQQIIENSELRKPLLQRIAEEKRRRLLAHSNSQILLMMQHGSLDLNDLTFTELKNRLNSMNMEPGVHSTLYLDQLFQPPTPTPQTSAPTTATGNRNNNDKENNSQQQQQQPPTSQSAIQSQMCLEQRHQLSPIIESKKVFNTNGSEDTSSDENITIKENENDDSGENENEQKKLADAAGAAETNDEDDSKSEITTPTSVVPESPSTMPQSPEIGNERTYSMSSNFTLHPKSRRSTVRTVSESGHVVDSSSLMPSSAMLPQMNGMGTSGQLPIQVILSSTPAGAQLSEAESKSKQNITIQSIPVRPLSKKDIFYAGSTKHISSIQHLAESGHIGQSIVSIPARDIIARVQKRIQQKENEDGEDDEMKPTTQSYQKRNVCNKILRVLCSFKNNCCRNNHHQPLNSANNNIEDPNELSDCEMNSMKQQQQPKDIDDDDDDVDDDQMEEKLKLSCWNSFMSKLPPSMRSILNEMLDFSLLRDSNAFTILAISNIFGMMGFYVPFVYITQFATSSVLNGDKLVTPDQAAILISIIGITNTFGRLIFGYLSDLITKNGTIFGVEITALGLNNICVILSGIAVIAAPFCTTYMSVIIDCVLFGLFISAYVCLTSVILVDMLGLDKLTNAFGLLCLFRGAASLIGPPLAGALFDMTKSYHITFAASGILLIISSIMAFFIKPKGGDRTVEQEPEDCDV